MKPHTRHYKILVNDKPFIIQFSVEAYSNGYIEKGQDNFISEQKKLGRIKDGDKVEFRFNFSTSN